MLNWVRQLFSSEDAPAAAPQTPPPPGEHGEHGEYEEHAAQGKVQLAQGNFTEAISHYRAAIAAQPGDAMLRLNLGFALTEAGHAIEAHASLQQALQIKPNLSDAHYLLGALAAEQGEAEPAAAHWRRALTLAPDFEIAYLDLCRLLLAHGETEAATILLEQGLAQLPQSADLHCYRARLYHEVQQAFPAAAKHYRAAIACAPQLLSAYRGLYDILHRQGLQADAMTLYRAALPHFSARPADAAELHLGLGNLLYLAGRREEAVTSYGNALHLKPGDGGALRNLGTALFDLGRFAQAEDAYRAAIAAQPGHIDTRMDLLSTLYTQGHFAQAIAVADDVIGLAPAHAGAHFGKAQALLARGDLGAGWQEYESRWEYLANTKPPFSQPEWDGKADLQDKTIVLHAEQGYGDTLQFIRYAGLLAQRGARVLVLAPASLQTLLASCPGVAQVFSAAEMLPPFDTHCALLSLPLLLGTELDSIPAPIPYLHGTAAKQTSWRERLDANHGRPSAVPSVIRVGLAWAGNPANAADRARSMHFQQWLPLLDVAGLEFFSLQLGDAAAQLNGEPRVIDYTAALHDFDDTAALMAQLDLVISVDTAVVHLAGALGKPVWLLNRYNSCWRWLAGRDDSPWYPIMRLFRQPGFGDWDSVMDGVARALVELAASHRNGNS